MHFRQQNLSKMDLPFSLSAGVPEEAGPQAGSGLLPSETSPTPHQVPAAAQGSVHLSQSEIESPVEMQLILSKLQLHTF